MKVGVLFSGGKDSVYAAYLARQSGLEIECLITLIPSREDSYMFHVPNIKLASLSAQAMGIRQIAVKTEGEKEKELDDLDLALRKAKKLGVQGIVTGAISSTYQATRIQRICNELGLWCFNPLWQKDQLELIGEIVGNGFDVIIVGVYAYPLTKDWLGKRFEDGMIKELGMLQKRYNLNPAGEGGEIETFVLDSPLHKTKITIRKSRIEYSNNSGQLIIEEAAL